MKRRAVFAAVALGAALLLVFLAGGAAGCGQTDNAVTTAAPQTTTTTAPAVSAAVTAGTEAVTTTTAATPSGLSNVQGKTTSTGSGDYLTQMLAFGQALAALPVTDDPSNFTDAAAITSDQLKAAQKYASGVHSVIDQLKAIQPPADVADAHQKVVADMDALATATDKLLTAAQAKDQAAFDAAQTEGKAAAQALQTDMEALRSLLGGTTPKS